MSLRKPIAIVLAAAAMAALPMDLVFACSCQRSPDDVRSLEGDMKWRYERATDVLRGRILEVKATPERHKSGYQVVVADMLVSAPIKGGFPTGVARIVTPSSEARCGVSDFLLQAVGGSTEVLLEVRRDAEHEYWASYCGFRYNAPQISFQRPTP